MKKILFAALVITFFLTNAYSQSENQKSVWQRFQPAQEEFSIEFPQKVADKSEFDLKGALETGFYRVLFNQTYFSVYSGDEKEFTISDLLKRFIRAHRPVESAQKIGEFSGVLYTLRDDEDFYHKVLEIKAKDRSYIFHTISEAENSAEIKRFFDSIEFVDRIGVKPKSTTIEKAVEPENTNAVVSPIGNGTGGRGSGIGNGTGVGTGNGTGIGSGTRPLPVQSNQTSPVKFLSKPRANYTDLARTFWITGRLRLRITFLATGEIGKITPVTKLPLGLTKNAIQAAQKIRFEPALNEGKPTSVVKIVEYTFTLY